MRLNDHHAKAHRAPKARSLKCDQYSAETGYFFFRLNIKTFFLQVKVKVFLFKFENTTNTKYYPMYRTCVKSQSSSRMELYWTMFDQEKKEKTNIVQHILFNSLCRLGLWGTLYFCTWQLGINKTFKKTTQTSVGSLQLMHMTKRHMYVCSKNVSNYRRWANKRIYERHGEKRQTL